MVTKAKVIAFDRLIAKLERLIAEMRELSKKKADGTVNAFKVTLINQALEAANEFLEPDLYPMKTFRTFDEAMVPSNSDVVIALSQYLGALEVFRSLNLVQLRKRQEYPYTGDAVWWVWDTTERSLKTKAPSARLGSIRVERVDIEPDAGGSEDDEDYEEDDPAGGETDEDEERDA